MLAGLVFTYRESEKQLQESDHKEFERQNNGYGKRKSLFWVKFVKCLRYFTASSCH